MTVSVCGMARKCLLRWRFACSFREDSPVTAGVDVFQLRAARWFGTFIASCDLLLPTIGRVGVWEKEVTFQPKLTDQHLFFSFYLFLCGGCFNRKRPLKDRLTLFQVCLKTIVRCSYELWNRFCLILLNNADIFQNSLFVFPWTVFLVELK